MLFAISTLLYINENIKNGVDFSGINSTGINNVELSFPVHANELILKKLSNQGLKVISGHADFINTDISSPDKKLRENSINIINERILFLKKAGGKFLVVHPGDYCKTEKERSTRLGFSISSLNKILAFAEKYGVCIAVENMPNSFFGDSPEELLYILEEVRKNISRKESIGICFDSGHAFLTGTLEIYLNNYLQEIVSMHIHDNFGDINRDYRYAPDDRHLTPGSGSIDWVRFIETVKKSYKGAFVFEIMPQQNCSNIEGLLADINVFMKRLPL